MLQVPYLFGLAPFPRISAPSETLNFDKRPPKVFFFHKVADEVIDIWLFDDLQQKSFSETCAVPSRSM